MTEEATIDQAPVQEVPAAAETAPTNTPPAAPEKKKRGRKPKIALLPPVPAEAPKPTRKRRTVVRVSKGDRAFSAALASAEKDRGKCIEELSKIMEAWDVKQARLKSLDWKISALKGNTSTSAIAGMQLQSYAQQPHPQMPATFGNYPAPQMPTTFVPPSMRTPAIPAIPQAGGGAVDGIVESQVSDEEDQFLKGGIVGERGWV